MPPKGPVTIAKNPNSGTSGVLPVNPANIQNAPAKLTVRLKLEVRRLPPGLTKQEFESAIGHDWKVGAGKVDWLEYRQGKVKSPGKHPEQSRASLHLTNESHISSFEAAFLAITFHDAKGTYKDQNLKALPPTLDFAPIQRIPAGKPRTDGRQGTIDQDPEYMAFLESETQPVPKPTALDSTGTEKIKETITTTPLIEALREKKANKEKAKAAKSAKREEAKEDKAEKGGGRKGTKSAENKTKTKAESTAKDAPKAKQAVKTATNGSTSTAESISPAAPTAPNKKRERAPANIKSMLQRDLGLGESPRRGGKERAAGTGATASETAERTSATANAQSQNAQGRNNRAKKGREIPSAESVSGATVSSAQAQSSAPVASANKASAPQSQSRAPKAKAEANGSTNTNETSKAQPAKAVNVKAAKAAPQPSAGSTKAYLKHANASQGVTEALLREALSTFGEVTALEIDKRKGTALATFKDYENLKAAMAKRTISVGQGAVEVLEYKDKPAGNANRGATNARGGGGSGGGGNSGRGKGRGSGRGGGSAAAATTESSTAASAVTAAPSAAPAAGDGT